MPNSSRMQWIFPGENEDPWYQRFRSMIMAMDASGYASREDRHTILAEGGTIAWDANVGVTWTAEVWLTAPITGFSWRFPAQTSALSVSEGQCIYAILNRGTLENKAITAVVAGTVPSTDDAIVLAIRIGDKLYFRNGQVLDTGGSFMSGFGSGAGGGGGGGGATTISESFNELVVGDSWEQVGSRYLAAGTLAAPARVFAGTMDAADGVEVQLIRETGATVVATWTATGLLQEITLGATVIPAADWYHIRLRGDAGGVTALLKGIHWVYA